MTHSARLALTGLVVLSFGACGQGTQGSAASSADHSSGRQEGCVEAGGVWNKDANSCAQAPNWLMVQHADGVAFSFDDATAAGCPAGAFWSGTMVMSGAGPDTLWFSDRPNRLAYKFATAGFVSVFAEAFGKESGGDPNAVLTWEDAATGDEKAVVVELVADGGRSPSYDADSETLTYEVCGLRLDDPKTLTPLSESEQVAPESVPTAAGRYSLFIDNAAAQGMSDFVNGVAAFFTGKM